MSKLTFYDWMMRYKNKDTPRGDLAQDMIRDASFPRDSNNYKSLFLYLSLAGACFEALDVFERCWKGYRKYMSSKGMIYDKDTGCFEAAE